MSECRRVVCRTPEVQACRTCVQSCSSARDNRSAVQGALSIVHGGGGREKGQSQSQPVEPGRWWGEPEAPRALPISSDPRPVGLPKLPEDCCVQPLTLFILWLLTTPF